MEALLELAIGGMTMKKRALGGLVLVALMGTSACGTMELSQKQTSEVAEYAAGLIVKYNKGYEPRLVYPEATATPLVTSTPVAATQKPSSGSQTSPSQGGQKADGEDAPTTSSSLGEILGVKEFTASVARVELTQEYTDKKLDYYSVYAGNKKQLLVITMKLKNVSGKEKKLFFSETGVDYRIKLSDGTSCSAELTMLDNDLQFLNTKVKAGKTKNAVLVFQIPDKVKTVDGTITASLADQNTSFEISSK